MMVEVCVPTLAEGIISREQKAIESDDFIYNQANSYIIQLMHVEFWDAAADWMRWMTTKTHLRKKRGPKTIQKGPACRTSA